MAPGTYGAVDHGDRHYQPEDFSETRCRTCFQRLLHVLVEAGEINHPTCVGYPAWWYGELERGRRAEKAKAKRKLDALAGKIGLP
jgi:hypothetical protein